MFSGNFTLTKGVATITLAQPITGKDSVFAQFNVPPGVGEALYCEILDANHIRITSSDKTSSKYGFWLITPWTQYPNP